MFHYRQTEFKKQEMLESYWKRRVTILILRTHLFCKEQSTLTTPFPRNLISAGFLITKHGDLTKDIMEHSKDLIRQRQLKSMAKSKYYNGEEVMTFHLQLWLWMMKDTHNINHNIQNCQLQLYHVLNHWQSQLIGSYLSGMILYALQFSTDKMLLLLLTAIHLEPLSNISLAWVNQRSLLITFLLHAHLCLNLIKIWTHLKTITYSTQKSWQPDRKQLPIKLRLDLHTDQIELFKHIFVVHMLLSVLYNEKNKSKF